MRHEESESTLKKPHVILYIPTQAFFGTAVKSTAITSKIFSSFQPRQRGAHMNGSAARMPYSTEKAKQNLIKVHNQNMQSQG